MADRLGARDTALVGEEQARVQRTQAEWLSTINLSSSATWEFPLKTFARPKGKATRVIITEYDLPRPTIEPHDVIVDAEGMAWYSNFGEQMLGKLDPKTGKVTEYPVPEPKKGFPTGALSLRSDNDGNLWLGHSTSSCNGAGSETVRQLCRGAASHRVRQPSRLTPIVSAKAPL